MALALSKKRAMALLYAIGAAAIFFLVFFLMEMESSDGRWLSIQGFRLARWKSDAAMGSFGSTANWIEMDKIRENLMKLAKEIDCQSSSGLATHNSIALFFMADYQNFPSDTPIDELFYLKAVLLARTFNPTVPVYFLLPKAVLALHPDMAKVLGDYRINVRWIDSYLEQHYFITFEGKHMAFCKRLNITDCFRNDMYHRFGMAAQILKVEGFNRAIFLDNDVALYSDISFITKYSESFVSPYEWSSQAALWDVDVMDQYYKWLMQFFDTEPLGKELDPGDMHGVRIFLERHPLVSRRILCGKESWWYCKDSPDYWQAMENVGYVGCDKRVMKDDWDCPLFGCGDGFDKLITWQLDEENRSIPFFNKTLRLPSMHFQGPCKDMINKKMYPGSIPLPIHSEKRSFR